VYEFDYLGQVKSGKRCCADGTPFAGQQFEYAFDDIGNRTPATTGGDAEGSPSALRSSTYTSDRLNRYTSRTVPGAVDVLGTANPAA
jgi:hypothetical protein